MTNGEKELLTHTRHAHTHTRCEPLVCRCAVVCFRSYHPHSPVLLTPPIASNFSGGSAAAASHATYLCLFRSFSCLMRLTALNLRCFRRMEEPPMPLPSARLPCRNIFSPSHAALSIPLRTVSTMATAKGHGTTLPAWQNNQSSTRRPACADIASGYAGCIIASRHCIIGRWLSMPVRSNRSIGHSLLQQADSLLEQDEQHLLRFSTSRARPHLDKLSVILSFSSSGYSSCEARLLNW